MIQTLSNAGIPQSQSIYAQMEEFQWRIALSQLSSAILMKQQGAEQSDPIFDLKLQQYMRGIINLLNEIICASFVLRKK